MKKFLSILAALLLLASVLAFLVFGKNIAILNPQGMIAVKESNLLITAVILASIAIFPVIFLVFFTAWKFREGSPALRDDSDRERSWWGQFIWWSIPAVFIIIFAVITWNSAHDLDPRKSINSSVKPLTIQVVALQWKWLFIYPEQNIATVNFVQFPAGTPIKFNLTADAPMNSFWIPQLAGQIYAMPGMGTYMELIADKQGDFTGSAAEISGQGFAGMRFVARASSKTSFDSWASSVRQFSNILDMSEYNKLAAPSQDNKVTFYAAPEDNLYNKVMMKFMSPSASPTMQDMQEMNY